MKQKITLVHLHSHKIKLLAILMLAAFLCPAPKKAMGQNHKMSVDIFMGLDWLLSDMNYERQYDMLVALMPGFSWDMGNHWKLGGLVYAPIFNQYYSQDYNHYGSRYDRPYLSILSLSKEMKLGPVYCKASGGIFAIDRYGLDLKVFAPITRWLALEAQAGLTGRCEFNGGYFYDQWVVSGMQRFTFTVGGDIYLSKWNTQLRGIAGRFLYQDLGVQCEAMRHFRHSTIGLYAQWSDRHGIPSTTTEHIDGGFKVTVMIPPYHRKQRLINIRPISNYQMVYSGLANEYNNKLYLTDPEENERDGWFSRDLLKWGSHTMDPDFTIKGKEAE